MVASSSAVSDPVVSNERFLANVWEAREAGYAFVCAECGAGVEDESDHHDYGCPVEASNQESKP